MKTKDEKPRFICGSKDCRKGFDWLELLFVEAMNPDGSLHTEPKCPYCRGTVMFRPEFVKAHKARTARVMKDLDALTKACEKREAGGSKTRVKRVNIL
jgi:hypothetical protein